jgi:hypothetical protein
MAGFSSSASCFDENYSLLHDDFEDMLEVLSDEELINGTSNVISIKVSNFYVVFLSKY